VYWMVLLKIKIHKITCFILNIGCTIIAKLLLSRSRLCHYSVGGAWWHLSVYESFQYPVRISPATGVENEGVTMTE
jgi:hypothetical protein